MTETTSQRDVIAELQAFREARRKSGAHPLEYPQDFLWFHRPDGSLFPIAERRFRELLGGAAPETPTEVLLAGNRDWLRVYLASWVGQYPIAVTEGEALPELRDPEGVLSDEEVISIICLILSAHQKKGGRHITLVEPQSPV
jgi:hypothetical protein